MSRLPPLVVPGDVASLSIIAEYVISAGKAAGLDRGRVYRLRLAVDEIATNIVDHGYQAQGETGFLEVSADIDARALTICIRDTARPYDPLRDLENRAGKVPAQPLDERSEGGLGLFLAARSVDALDYSRSGGKNHNFLTMKLPPGAESGNGLHASLLIAVSPAERGRLTRALESSSYDITWAEDGHQIRQMLHMGHFDLLLLGLDLPGQTGEVCLRELRADRTVAVPPVVVLYESQSESRLESCLDDDIADILSLEKPPGLLYARVSRLVGRARLKAKVSALQTRNAELEALAHDFTEAILPLGIALSRERSREHLLERIVVEAMAVCRADAGTLYLRDASDRLCFSIMRTKSKGLVFGGTTGKAAPYPPLRIRHPDTGVLNYQNVATSAVIERRAISIPDIYDDKASYDFSGAKKFDQEIGYRTVSCLTVPLLGNGEAMGALQLLNAQDSVTGEVVPFSPYQQQVTESLASQAAIALYNQELIGDSKELLRLEGEMEIGRDIQANFLPRVLPEIPGWQVAARVRPARMVSGDFYDAFDLGNGCVGLVIADVCDKGVGAAIFMVLVRSLLRAFAQIDWIAEYAARREVAATGARPERSAGDGDAASERSRRQGNGFAASGGALAPSGALDDGTQYRLEVALRRSVCFTNDYIAHTHHDLDMFATFFFGVLIPDQGLLLYINCGHPPLLVCNRDGVRDRLATTGPAVGIIPGADFQVAQVTLEPGELMLGYTDGVTDARDAEGRGFGEERFLSQVESGPLQADEVLRRIEEAVNEHTEGVELFDDYTLLAVYREP